MLKKILITGASGQLGNAVLNQLSRKYDLLATDITSIQQDNLNFPFSILDITNIENIKNVLSKFHPDVVVNLAAYTDVDGCELNPERAHLLNTKSAEMLARNFDGQFIQISTDYIFDGNNGPYSENDTTNPLSIYGKTKLNAEKVLQDLNINYCIVRTNVLFDYYKGTQASFIKWVVDSLQSGNAINIVNDQWNNPTWTVNLAEFIELVIAKNVKGIYNYGGANYLNRLEFAQIIADIFNLDKTLISPISTASLNQIAPRPLRGGLKIEKIKREFDINSIDLEYSLKMVKSRLKA